MPRSLFLVLAAIMGIAVSAASAQTGGNATPKVQGTIGVVRAITASSMTLERDGKEMIFTLNASTRVFARVAGTRDLVLRNPPRPAINDIIKTGDHVVVSYRQSGPILTAVQVRVR